MTELEYILATDLRAIDGALAALHTIVPANNPALDPDAYRTMVRTLSRWRDAVYARIQLEV